MTFQCLPTGEIRCLWTDELPLRELGGEIQVARASNVDWDAAAGEWVVSVHGTELFRNASREVCLGWEHEHDELILDLSSDHAEENHQTAA